MVYRRINSTCIAGSFGMDYLVCDVVYYSDYCFETLIKSNQKILDGKGLEEF